MRPEGGGRQPSHLARIAARCSAVQKRWTIGKASARST
jgi:hypothetical protein